MRVRSFLVAASIGAFIFGLMLAGRVGEPERGGVGSPNRNQVQPGGAHGAVWAVDSAEPEPW